MRGNTENISEQLRADIQERLKKAGISDLWRFTEGTLANAISLGLFRDRELVEDVRRLDEA